MKYEDLIATVSEIVQNEKIFKSGMMLVYRLDERTHTQLNQLLFYKTNPITTKFEPSDEVEVELGGIIVRLIKIKPDDQTL